MSLRQHLIELYTTKPISIKKVGNKFIVIQILKFLNDIIFGLSFSLTHF